MGGDATRDDDACDRAAAAAAAAAAEEDSSNSNSNSGCGDGEGNGEGGATGEGELKKGLWTAEEDAILMECVQRFREGNWTTIAQRSGLARSGKSCRLRWVKHLSPAIRPGPLSEAEQRQVIELQRRYGNKWALMAQHMPGRSDNAIKNFWNSYRKRMQRRVKAAAAAARDEGSGGGGVSGGGAGEADGEAGEGEGRGEGETGQAAQQGEKEEQGLVRAGQSMTTPAAVALAVAAASASGSAAAASPVFLARSSTLPAAAAAAAAAAEASVGAQVFPRALSHGAAYATSGSSSINTMHTSSLASASSSSLLTVPRSLAPAPPGLTRAHPAAAIAVPPMPCLTPVPAAARGAHQSSDCHVAGVAGSPLLDQLSALRCQEEEQGGGGGPGGPGAGSTGAGVRGAEGEACRLASAGGAVPGAAAGGLPDHINGVNGANGFARVSSQQVLGASPMRLPLPRLPPYQAMSTPASTQHPMGGATMRRTLSFSPATPLTVVPATTPPRFPTMPPHTALTTGAPVSTLAPSAVSLPAALMPRPMPVPVPLPGAAPGSATPWSNTVGSSMGRGLCAGNPPVPAAQAGGSARHGTVRPGGPTRPLLMLPDGHKHAALLHTPSHPLACSQAPGGVAGCAEATALFGPAVLAEGVVSPLLLPPLHEPLQPQPQQQQRRVAVSPLCGSSAHGVRDVALRKGSNLAYNADGTQPRPSDAWDCNEGDNVVQSAQDRGTDCCEYGAGTLVLHGGTGEGRSRGGDMEWEGAGGVEVEEGRIEEKGEEGEWEEGMEGEEAREVGAREGGELQRLWLPPYLDTPQSSSLCGSVNLDAVGAGFDAEILVALADEGTGAQSAGAPPASTAPHASSVGAAASAGTAGGATAAAASACEERGQQQPRGGQEQELGTQQHSQQHSQQQHGGEVDGEESVSGTLCSPSTAASPAAVPCMGDRTPISKRSSLASHTPLRKSTPGSARRKSTPGSARRPLFCASIEEEESEQVKEKQEREERGCEWECVGADDGGAGGEKERGGEEGGQQGGQQAAQGLAGECLAAGVWACSGDRERDTVSPLHRHLPVAVAVADAGRVGGGMGTRVKDEVGKEMDADGTEMDGDGTEMDGDGTEMDGDGTEMDGDGTEMDGDGTEMDGNGTEMDGDGMEMDGDGNAVSGEGLADMGGGGQGRGGGCERELENGLLDGVVEGSLSGGLCSPVPLPPHTAAAAATAAAEEAAAEAAEEKGEAARVEAVGVMHPVIAAAGGATTSLAAVAPPPPAPSAFFPIRPHLLWSPAHSPLSPLSPTPRCLPPAVFPGMGSVGAADGMDARGRVGGNRPLPGLPAASCPVGSAAGAGGAVGADGVDTMGRVGGKQPLGDVSRLGGMRRVGSVGGMNGLGGMARLACVDAVGRATGSGDSVGPSGVVGPVRRGQGMGTVMRRRALRGASAAILPLPLAAAAPFSAAPSLPGVPAAAAAVPSSAPAAAAAAVPARASCFAATTTVADADTAAEAATATAPLLHVPKEPAAAAAAAAAEAAAQQLALLLPTNPSSSHQPPALNPSHTTARASTHHPAPAPPAAAAAAPQASEPPLSHRWLQQLQEARRVWQAILDSPRGMCAALRECMPPALRQVTTDVTTPLFPLPAADAIMPCADITSPLVFGEMRERGEIGGMEGGGASGEVGKGDADGEMVALGDSGGGGGDAGSDGSDARGSGGGNSGGGNSGGGDSEEACERELVDGINRLETGQGEEGEEGGEEEEEGGEEGEEREEEVEKGEVEGVEVVGDSYDLEREMGDGGQNGAQGGGCEMNQDGGVAGRGGECSTQARRMEVETCEGGSGAGASGGGRLWQPRSEESMVAEQTARRAGQKQWVLDDGLTADGSAHKRVRLMEGSEWRAREQGCWEHPVEEEKASNEEAASAGEECREKGVRVSKEGSSSGRSKARQRRGCRSQRPMTVEIHRPFMRVTRVAGNAGLQEVGRSVSMQEAAGGVVRENEQQQQLEKEEEAWVHGMSEEGGPDRAGDPALHEGMSEQQHGEKNGQQQPQQQSRLLYHFHGSSLFTPTQAPLLTPSLTSAFTPSFTPPFSHPPPLTSPHFASLLSSTPPPPDGNPTGANPSKEGNMEGSHGFGNGHEDGRGHVHVHVQVHAHATGSGSGVGSGALLAASPRFESGWVWDLKLDALSPAAMASH
ncbi:unnamed protein product [Closterium sp. NIES-54]